MAKTKTSLNDAQARLRRAHARVAEVRSVIWPGCNPELHEFLRQAREELRTAQLLYDTVAAIQAEPEPAEDE